MIKPRMVLDLWTRRNDPSVRAVSRNKRTAYCPTKPGLDLNIKKGSCATYTQIAGTLVDHTQRNVVVIHTMGCLNPE